MAVNWRQNWKTWLTRDSADGELLSGAEDETLAPLILRCAAARRPLLVVCPLLPLAEETMEEIQLWQQELGLKYSLRFLPEAAEHGRYIPENEADRVRILHDTMTSPVDITICSLNALLNPVPTPELLAASELVIKPGMDLMFNVLLGILVDFDYDDEFEVCVKGEFSRRGGIIDLFSPAHDFPVRIEFWGDSIESLRQFDPDTQRSIKEISEYRLVSRAGLDENSNAADYFDYLRPYHPTLIEVYPEQCQLHLERFGSEPSAQRWKTVQSGPHPVQLLDTVEAGVKKTVFAGCSPAITHLKKILPDELSGGGTEILQRLTAEQIRQWQDTGYRIVLLGRDAATHEHLRDWCREFQLSEQNIVIDHAVLPHGIIVPEMRLVFLTEKELFAARQLRRTPILAQPQPTESSTNVPATTSRNEILEEEVFRADIDEGDLVVHLIHGIGIFHGIRELKRNGSVREVLVIEYQDNAMLYVPLWQAGMVSKYIGARAGAVKLHKLGGHKWLQSKVEAERAVRTFALDLLKIQALRAAAQGMTFPADDLAQRIFEDAFPYEETADQLKSVAEIKADMCATKPMDRLLCGDVGYGKTEVAIRAAFKAVSSGKQVAIMVPTTVLAQQHYYSFRERFSGHPIIIEMLCRFKTKAEQSQIIQQLAEGKIDIIIGTHRLVQDDVVFKDLGLVVIDEEQRFGVKQKEKLKSLRATVDVLTMTATPIPRTLYMSMSGIRDLSTIITAPGIRLPVQTVVAHYDEEFICNAIRNEVKRGGQVFYLHNRIKSINDIITHLRKLLPDVRFGVGHGQMHEEELEEVMEEFLSGKIDVLVSTTIIESGLDIPNANTIIIERADRFGLAELYQLRGRVGRWNRQAYAYLLLPKSDIITPDARKRLSAIRRYTHLGAGFKLALRDLEIRGAGNLLGAEQSGYINNIGFELYCQLLRGTVAQLKGEHLEVLPEVDLNLNFIEFAHQAETGFAAAGIPPALIPSERLRIEAYRRLGNMTAIAEVDAFHDELEDRFGRLPTATENMLKVTKIRILTALAGFTSLSMQENRVILENAKGVYRRNGQIPIVNPHDPPDRRLENLYQTIALIAAQLCRQ